MASLRQKLEKDLKAAGFKGAELDAAVEKMLNRPAPKVQRTASGTAAGGGGGGGVRSALGALGTEARQGASELAGQAGSAAVDLGKRAAVGTARGLVPQESEDFRPAAAVGGAMVGAALGFASPVPGGALIGGVLGAGAGQTLFDFGEEAAGGKPRGIIENTQRALNEMALEAIFPGASGAIKAGKRAVLAKIADIGEAGKRLMAQAQELGIPLGIEALTGRGVINRMRNVAGRMPFFGPGFKESDVAVGGALRKRKGQLLGDIAPVVQAVTKTGVDLTKGAIKRNKSMNRLFRMGYEKLFKDADLAGSRIPTDGVVQTAQDLVTTHLRDLPTRTVKKKVARNITNRATGGVVDAVEPIKPTTPQNVIKFAETQVANLTADMSPRQYKALARQLNGLVSKFRDDPEVAGQAMVLKSALEKDLENIIGPQAFRDRVRVLNGQFHNYMELLDRPTGRQLGSATPGLFKIGFRGGGKNADEIFQFAFNEKSPASMIDLRQLVGPRAFRKAVATHVDSSFEKAIEGETKQFINLRTLRKVLGLGRPDSPEYETLEAALEMTGGGTRIADLQKFFDVMDAQFKLGIVDVSTFLARRANISGAKGVVRALTPGASVMSSAGGGAVGASQPFGSTMKAVLAITAVLGARKLSRVVTDPAMLKAATTMLDPAAPLRAGQVARRRIARLLAEEPLREDRPVSNTLSNLAFGRQGQAPQ